MVMQNGICHYKMSFKQEELVWIIDVQAPEELIDDIAKDDETPDDSMSEDKNAQANVRVMWSHPIVQGPKWQILQRSGWQST